MNKNVKQVIGFILVCFGVALITHYALNYFQTSSNKVIQDKEELQRLENLRKEHIYELGYVTGALNMVEAYDPKKDTKLIKNDFYKRKKIDSINYRNKYIKE